MARFMEPNGPCPQAPLSMKFSGSFLEWVVIPFTWGSSLSRIKHRSPALQALLPSELLEAPIVTVRVSVEILEFNWLESSDSSLTWSCVTLSSCLSFLALSWLIH